MKSENKITCPDCGGECEWVKLWESKRYSGFILCKCCGREGRAYTSKQAAIKAWRKGNGL